MDSSVPTILQSRVQFPCTLSTLFTRSIFLPFFHCIDKKTKINKKRPSLAHIFIVRGNEQINKFRKKIFATCLSTKSAKGLSWRQHQIYFMERCSAIRVKVFPLKLGVQSSLVMRYWFWSSTAANDSPNFISVFSLNILSFKFRPISPKANLTIFGPILQNYNFLLSQSYPIWEFQLNGHTFLCITS